MKRGKNVDENIQNVVPVHDFGGFRGWEVRITGAEVGGGWAYQITTLPCSGRNMAWKRENNMLKLRKSRRAGRSFKIESQFTRLSRYQAVQHPSAILEFPDTRNRVHQASQLRITQLYIQGQTDFLQSESPPI